MADPAHYLQTDPDLEFLTCLTTMDLSGDLDYWLDLVTVTGLDLFHLVQALCDFPIASQATTFACLLSPLATGFPWQSSQPLSFPNNSTKYTTLMSDHQQ